MLFFKHSLRESIDGICQSFLNTSWSKWEIVASSANKIFRASKIALHAGGIFGGQFAVIQRYLMVSRNVAIQAMSDQLDFRARFSQFAINMLPEIWRSFPLPIGKCDAR
jgi:hypothetical protein